MLGWSRARPQVRNRPSRRTGRTAEPVEPSNRRTDEPHELHELHEPRPWPGRLLPQAQRGREREGKTAAAAS